MLVNTGVSLSICLSEGLSVTVRTAFPRVPVNTGVSLSICLSEGLSVTVRTAFPRVPETSPFNLRIKPDPFYLMCILLLFFMFTCLIVRFCGGIRVTQKVNFHFMHLS